MFYHCRPLKYVTYGKVCGCPEPDEFLSPSYRWLGQHCGFCPQVWLSRSQSAITGFRPWMGMSKKAWTKVKRQRKDVLFAFDPVVGFPVDYDMWHMIISGASAYEGKFGPIKDKTDAKMFERWFWKDMAEYDRENPGPPEEMLTHGLDSVDKWLKQLLFVERDQVVVPSLNLKAAKQVFCQDERTKGELRKMGFIEDRIRIRNFHHAN
jgi:hypothetical protein